MQLLSCSWSTPTNCVTPWCQSWFVVPNMQLLPKSVLISGNQLCHPVSGPQVPSDCHVYHLSTWFSWRLSVHNHSLVCHIVFDLWEWEDHWRSKLTVKIVQQFGSYTKKTRILYSKGFFFVKNVTIWFIWFVVYIRFNHSHLFVIIKWHWDSLQSQFAACVISNLNF